MNERNETIMVKKDIIKVMATKMDTTQKQAEQALDAFMEVVTEALVAGDRVSLVGFGAFEVTNRAARMGRNPQTGEDMEIPATKAPKFKAGKILKEAVK